MTSLLLVDANNLFYRAWHGVKAKLSTSDGAGTWGIHATVNTIAVAVRETNPTHVLVAFDQGVSAWRKELFPAYKAARKHDADPDRNEAQTQLRQTERLLELFGLFVAVENGVEADDIIATAALRWRDDFEEVWIVSGDKDLRQLIGENVRVMVPSLGGKVGIAGAIWDEDAVRARYGGLSPTQLVDVWSLTGDVSDGVPGVRGVGEKTAVKLIQQYGSASAVAVSQEKKILGQEDAIHIAHRLIELNGGIAECRYSLDQLLWEPVEVGTPDGDALERALHRFELESLLGRWHQGFLWKEAPSLGRKLQVPPG